jgi:hypothetical protein
MVTTAEVPLYGGPQDGRSFVVPLDPHGRPPPILTHHVEGLVCEEYTLERTYHPTYPERGMGWRYVHPTIRT